MNLRNGLKTYHYQTFDTHDHNFLKKNYLNPFDPFMGQFCPIFGAMTGIWISLQSYSPPILVQKIHSQFFLYQTRRYFTVYYFLMSKWDLVGKKGANWCSKWARVSSRMKWTSEMGWEHIITKLLIPMMTTFHNFSLRPIWPICGAILTYFGAIIGIRIPLWS